MTETCCRFGCPKDEDENTRRSPQRGRKPNDRRRTPLRFGGKVRTRREIGGRQRCQPTRRQRAGGNTGSPLSVGELAKGADPSTPSASRRKRGDYELLSKRKLP